MKTNNVYSGDNVKLLSQLKGDLVDLTVTSPPYDKIREYKNGLSWNFEAVANQLFRVTKAGGIVVWVIKDAVEKGSETLTSFKQALFFREIGFNLHDTMIYLKNNPIPQFKTKRYTDSFEYMFIFSKGVPSTCNYLEVETRSNGRVDNNYRGQMDSSGNYIGTERKVVKNKKIKTNVWNYSPNNDINKKLKHPAQFPESLARDHILSWTNKGDLVLDPFVGSGTTVKIAKDLGRRFLGFDNVQEYVNMSKLRLSE